MSRIGRAPIAIPAAVKVSQDGPTVRVEGPKGKLSFTVPEEIAVTLADNTLTLSRKGDEARVRALHGLSRALLMNMVTGVAAGFSRELEIVGIGYRAQLQGKSLTLSVGFSHPVVVPIPEGLTVEVPKPTNVIVRGADKQQVGQFAANLRRIAPPEPYKGKGIKYAGEVIRRKAGKAATGTGAKAGA
jgi:large subunit ribosomal protein L6